MSSLNASINLSHTYRKAVYDTLVEKSLIGKLTKGTIKNGADKYMVSATTVSKIWHRRRESIEEVDPIADVSGRKSGA